MKNVLEFVYYLFDGGAETLVKEYCIMMDKDKWNPIVLTIYPNYSSSVYKILKENNIKIYNIYPRRNKFFQIINKIFGRWYFPYRLNNILIEENISVIHCHTAVLKYIGYSSKIISNQRIVYTCHSTPERYFAGRLAREYDVAKSLIKIGNFQMIALHKEMKEELDLLFGINNTVVIRNGIDFFKYKNINKTKLELRKELHIPENAFVIGHVGRFFEPKNHKFLVDVFIQLKKRKSNAFLVLVGDGKLKNAIKEKLRVANLENDYLLLSNRSDVPLILKTMDVFAFPSLVEGLGIALIEAQAVGLKCIASSNIPDAACPTNLVSRLSLEDSLDDWVIEILKSPPTIIKGVSDLRKYDMNCEINKLEKIYNGDV